ncbi:hypothetical protein [Erythrobacter sp.]|jgi:hypothetical protein|uniref:hypothetical protein n=1 Tax=Erythrobacter sp. TaxID=1042 RepID=UPI002E9DFD47|nr:hypothetical protein [Erythrobacter sp.]
MNGMTKTNRKRWGFWSTVMILAVVGAAVGYLGADFVDRRVGGQAEALPDASELAAFLVGAIYLVSAAVVGLGSAASRFGMAMDMVDDSDDWADQRRMLGLSALGCGAWGGALILLALSRPLGWADDIWVLVLLAIFAVVLAASTWMT